MSPGPEPETRAAAGDVADHLRLLVESQPDYAIFLLDESGHVLTWNGGARRLKGYEADEIIGRHFSAFYPDEQVGRGRPGPDPGVRRGRRAGYEAEGWRVRKDGTPVLGRCRDHRAARRATARSSASARSRATSRAGSSRSSSCARRRPSFGSPTPSSSSSACWSRACATTRSSCSTSSGAIRTWNAGAEHIKGYTADEVDRPALRAVLHRGGACPPAPRLRAGGRDARGPLRGGGLARPQGRHAVLGQRRHHGPARRPRRARRLRQGHARPDRAPRGAAAARGVRARRARGSRAAAPPQRRAGAGQPRDRGPARPGRDPPDRDRRGDRAHRRRVRRLRADFTGTDVVCSDDIGGEARAPRPAEAPVRSYLAVPIRDRRRRRSRAACCSATPKPGVFDAEAEAAASSIASTAAVAIANARLLESARRETAAREVALHQRDQVALALQQSLLPPDLPEIPGLELGAHYHAGTELVGGDFYDVFALARRTPGASSWATSAAAGPRPRRRPRSPGTPSAPPRCSTPTRRPSCTRSTARCCARTRRASPPPCSCASSTSADRDEVAVSDRLRRAIPRRSSSAPTARSRNRPRAGRCSASPTSRSSACRVAHHRLRRGRHARALHRRPDRGAPTRASCSTSNGVEATLERAPRDAPPASLANALVDAALEHAGGPLSDDVAIVILRVPHP